MHAPLDMTLSEIRESNKVYKKILNYLLTFESVSL